MAVDVLVRNNVKVFGNGTKAMLFAHGFGCDQNMWRYIYPAFQDKYKIILFDYVGSGKSDLNAYNIDRYSNLNGYAEDVLDVIHALDLKEVVMAGHSVSSMVGLLAAVKRPDLFDKLIFVGPSPCYINHEGYTGGFEHGDIVELLETMNKNYIGWANFLAPAIMKNADRPELAEELNESFCSTDPVIAHHFAKATFFSDNRSDLPKLKTPSLIIQCTDDMIAPIEVGEYMHRNLPQSTLRIVEATGHCPHLSAPNEIIAVITEYLN